MREAVTKRSVIRVLRTMPLLISPGSTVILPLEYNHEQVTARAAAAHARTKRRQRKGGGRSKCPRLCSIFREGEGPSAATATPRAGCANGGHQGSSGGVVTARIPRDEQPPANTDRRRQARSRPAANTVSQSS
ncbi:hypothetical protein MRX96_034346 [Rhipicephalus microplus]